MFQPLGIGGPRSCKKKGWEGPGKENTIENIQIKFSAMLFSFVKHFGLQQLYIFCLLLISANIHSSKPEPISWTVKSPWQQVMVHQLL